MLWVAALLAIGAIVFALTYGPLFARIAGRMNWHGGGPGANFATVARIWAHYLGLVVWPARLVADYSFNTFPVSTGLLDPRAIASALLLAVLAVGAVRSWRRGGAFGFGAAWWAITLLPVSHIVPYRELMAEHYLYIPMVGVAFTVAGWTAWALAAAPERRQAVFATVLLVAAALSARTIVRNRDWRTQETLWKATVAAAPDCARARFNLGQAYYEAIRFADAEREWLAADALKPGDLATGRALAALYYRQGKYDVARARIEEALRTAPEDPDAQVLAGWIAVDNGEPARALPYFEAAVKKLPANKEAGARLGIERAQKALNPTQQTAQRLKRGAQP
jgi:Tfp pilus assembly protein PilF